MLDLVLVLPELAVSSEPDARQSSGAQSDIALTAARFSSVRRLHGGWRGWFARTLGCEALGSADPASVVAASRATDARGAWLATPLQLAAGMQTVHVPVDGILELGPGEASDWCREFSRVFGADGLRLEPLPGGALLLIGLDAPGVLSVEPTVLVGRSLGDALPQGVNASRVRALMAELEMWLHDHPLNAERQGRGEPCIGSLWLWGGGGAAWEGPLERGAATAEWDRLYADDPWIAVLAGLSKVPLSQPPESFDGIAVAGPGRVGLVVSPSRLAGGAAAPGSWSGISNAVDRLYVRPALQALSAGALGSLTVVAGDRATRLCRSDRFWLWRPARTWAGALAG